MSGSARAFTDGGIAQPGRAPLWATFALTWINNFGAATSLIAIYFIAKSRFDFTPRENLMLGLLQGVTYIAGAMSVGVGSRLLAGPGRAISTRALLALLQVALAALCFMPLVFQNAWSVWLLVGIYSPLTGWLWPIIESFLSAGRTGATLRRSASVFNFSWASSQVLTFWIISPFLSNDPPSKPLWTIAAMGLSHLICLPAILAIPRDPGSHDHGDDPALSTAERVNYRKLLVCFRIAIVMSYVVYSALNPLLPARMSALGIAEGSPANTLLTSVWMSSRVLMFLAMGAWAGWHGRRHALVWSIALLLGGFATCMLAPNIPIMAFGLAVFGVGLGAIYSAAFYYAMEVGSAAVDAGGKHEALIGLGYTAGPLAGLGAEMAILANLIPGSARTHGGEAVATHLAGSGQLPLVTLIAVLVLALPAIALIVRQARDKSQ
ncbi:MAG TPA: hypothetical protein VG797_02420 [Phycisphaerales bacterium]|nr:hypothetical protein [Phycisphaerales bacterium]